MDNIIWLIIMIPVSLLFTGIGIFAWQRKKPMWFWSGSTVKGIEENQLKPLDHCYLNTPWHEYPENSGPGSKEYIYAPIFLCHAKEIMAEEAFYSFLKEVYQTYAMKIVHSGDILEILRKHDNSSEMNELLAFYFDESQE